MPKVSDYYGESEDELKEREARELADLKRRQYQKELDELEAHRARKKAERDQA